MSSRRNRRSSGQHRPVDVQGVESPVGSTASTASVTSESCPTTPRSPFPSSPVPNDAMSPTAPDSPSPASVGNRAPVEPDFWTELQLAFACSSENVSTGWVLMLLPALLLLFIAYDCYCLLQAGGQLNFSLNKYEARHVANRHSDDLLQQGLPPQLQNIVQSAKNNTAEQGWNFVGKYDGVDTFNKKIHGSKLLAFRGVALLDVHISQAMGPFINVTHALEWVSVLKSIEKMSIDPNATIDGVKRNCNYVDEDTDIIYQVSNPHLTNSVSSPAHFLCLPFFCCVFALLLSTVSCNVIMICLCFYSFPSRRC